MNYIGSKLKLIDFVKNTIAGVVVGDLSRKMFCDLFAGTGIVGRTFKTDCKKVIANDAEYYSFVLNRPVSKPFSMLPLFCHSEIAIIRQRY